MTRNVRMIIVCGLLAGFPVRAEIIARDALDQTVILPEPAARIVSLAPHVTETLFAAGAGGRVVGVVEHSDYPPEAAELPRVGGYTNLDLEAILVLQPDLAVAWRGRNPDHQLRKLRELGVPIFVTDPRRPEDVAEIMEQLGVLAGSAETARRTAERFRARLAQLRARYADRSPVSVFYQAWHRPLVTLSDRHLVGDLIALCGGGNVFGDLPVPAPHIDPEAVLAADPQVIVASGMGEERPEWLDDWRRWPLLTAVVHGNLFVVPPDLIQRHGPRILEGAERLCEALEVARERLGR